MKESNDQLERRMRALAGAFRAGVRRRLAARLPWIALAAALGLVLLDAVLALPAALRGLLALAFAPGLAALAIVLYRRMTAARSFERMVARAIENAEPSLDNTLVNALDFRQQLDGAAAGGVPRALMETELANAARAAEGPALAARLRQVDVRADLRVLGVLGAGALAALVLLWPVFLAVVPRYVAPGADHPPYNPTRLRVEPAGATVDYGDSLNVAVTAAGPRPRSPKLVLAVPDGAPVARLPLYESAPGTYLQTIEHVTSDLTYHAAMEGGRSKRHLLRVARAPRIDTVRVRYEFPAYTRLRADTRFLADQVLRGYAGTRATLLLTANRPLRGGAITVGGTTHAMTPGEDPTTVSGTFDLAGDGSFEAVVTDEDGNPGPRPVAGRVEILPDRPPEIAVVSPGTDSYATPGAQVPLNIEARDDLGVRRIEIYRSLNDSPDFRRTVFEHPGGLTFANAIETFHFADLGVKPGDIVDYYVAVTDTDPATPHTAASRSYRLMIISDEQFRELMQAQMTAEELRRHYEDLAAGLRELADLQRRAAEDLAALREKLAQQGEPDPAEQARLADLEARQEVVGEEARRLAAEFRDQARADAVFDIEQDFKKRLAQFADRLDEAARLMQEGADEMGGARRAGARDGREAALARAAERQQQALRQLGESAEQYAEGVGRAGREIEQVFALTEDVEHFKYLLERQKGIERQGRFLSGIRDPGLEDRVRMKELAEEQEAVRAELVELRRAFEEHGARIQEHYPKVAQDAQDIADRIGELEIPGHMEQAAGAFQRSDGTGGHGSAKEAYDAMLSLVSQCNGAGGEKECELRLRISMNMALGNTFEQLARSLNFGEGDGGEGAGMGRGRAGRGGGGQMAYHVYGNAELNNANRRSAGAGRRPRDLPPEAGAGGRLAADTEELAVAKDAELRVEGRSEEGVMAEYQRLISEYFRRMAEE